jgi:hypothetical protein
MSFSLRQAERWPRSRRRGRLHEPHPEQHPRRVQSGAGRRLGGRRRQALPKST